MSIKQKLQSNIFYLYNLLTRRVSSVEREVQKLKEQVERELAIQRNHLVRLKNGEEVSDRFLAHGMPYNDISPEKAWKIFQSKDTDFVFLDVSSEEFQKDSALPVNRLQIPLENLEARWNEIPNKTTPVLVISEDGRRSVLACEFLCHKGLFNCNNVSGGWKYWPAFKDINASEAQSA